MSDLYFPILETDRLQLRPMALADAPRVQLLAADREIAKVTARIPHPYPEGAAEAWINQHPALLDEGKELVLGVVLKSSCELIGAAGLSFIDFPHSAEIGYWIGTPYWSKGYGREGVAALVEFAFEELEIHRLGAPVMARNPRSCRLLEKLGFEQEGLIRQSLYKWGAYEDVVIYGRLREEFSS